MFSKELDLLRFVKKSRMVTLAVFSLLGSKQRTFIQRLAADVPIKEDLESGNSSGADIFMKHDLQ